MKGGFFARLSKVVDSSDIILEVLDARFPGLTRNRDLEQKVIASGKRLLFVINKADFASKRHAEAQKKLLSQEAETFFVSAKKRQGISLLRNRLFALAEKKRCVCGVVGYPNTGKSSLINILVGRRVAGTSKKAGFTRGERLVRVSKNLLLFDSPGTIPFDENDEFRLMLVNSKTAEQLSDPENTGMQFAEFVVSSQPDFFEKNFGLTGTDAEALLEAFALKKGFLLSGGRPDCAAAAKFLIMQWQSGKIRF